MRAIVIAVAVLFAAARPFMPTAAISWPGAYQAFAHLFVGGLLGAWCLAYGFWLIYREPAARTDARFYLRVALALSILEVICAVAKRAT